jgi:hypothetical protein
VESDENSSFGDNIRVLEIHGHAKTQVDKMTSSMADPAGKKLFNKCNLL